MNQEYNILIKKLRGFINKYYTNLILKGLILSLTIILITFLTAATFEYISWNSMLVRTVIFYLSLAIIMGVLFYYVIKPLLKLARLGKTLSQQDAADIIGTHFPEVNDRLLNTLQLKQILESSDDRSIQTLLEASIDQRSLELSPIPFRDAIDFKSNSKYLKYLVIPSFVIVVLLIVFPAFIVEPSNRIVNHNRHYSRPLPYKLFIQNEQFNVLEKENYELIVKAEGEILPLQVLINDGKYDYVMYGPKDGLFYHTFKNVNQDIYFTYGTDDFQSQKFLLKVLPKPTIYSFDVELIYPEYLRRKTDLLENTGDLVVPAGTSIKWLIYTKDTETINFRQNLIDTLLRSSSGNVFTHQMTAKENFWYSLSAANPGVKNIDSLSFSVQVIEDAYPSIDIQELIDDEKLGFVYFNGAISDDHGFLSLRFYYRFDSTESTDWKFENIEIDKNLPKQVFNYTINPGLLKLSPGDGLSYYFEVRDNDRNNGFKRSKTNIEQFKLDDRHELEDKYSVASNEIKEKIKAALESLKEINQQLKEKREDLINKKEVGWSDKQQLAELLNKQKEIEKQINDLKNINEELNKYEDMLDRDKSQQLEEKMDKINEMIDQLSPEDAEKIKEDLEKVDKDKLSEMLEQLRQNNANLENSLEQNLELFKQLEFENKINDVVEEMKKLAEEQLELAEQTKNKQQNDNESLMQQKEIQDQFSAIEQNLQDAEEMNQNLEQPFELDTKQNTRDSISNEMEQANENLSKGKSKKASGNQENAGQKMNKLANDLSMMMQSAMMSRIGEDAEMIKKILDNLIDLSFNQESLMSEVRQTSANDPKYVQNIRDYQLLKEGYAVLHDSLIEISKRQMAVQQFIVSESDKINLHINRALLYLQDRRRGQALSDQQYAMTSMNNLALMLAESLDQMQASMQMSGEQPGQSCPNPGQGKPGQMQQMIQMQQGLNEGMQKGLKNEGQGGKNGLNQQSEELARMAAMQSEIRKRLNEYMNQLEEGDVGNGDLSKIIDEMKKTEEDIVNRRINKETLERQKQIEVRLLKSEKAKLEREKKETRESREGLNRTRKPKSLRNAEPKSPKTREDLLQPIPIEMSPYFNDLLKRYLYKLETHNGT